MEQNEVSFAISATLRVEHAAWKMETHTYHYGLPNFSSETRGCWKKDVWHFEAFSKTIIEVRVSLGNVRKQSKNYNSQSCLGNPKRLFSNLRPPDLKQCKFWTSFLLQFGFLFAMENV